MISDTEAFVLAARLDRIANLESRLHGFYAAIGTTAVFTIILPAIAGAVGRYLS